MRRVILCPNPFKDRNLEVTREAMALLTGAGFEVCVCPELLDDLPDGLPADVPLSSLYDVIDGAFVAEMRAHC